jgi:virginiamycin B lyase
VTLTGSITELMPNNLSISNLTAGPDGNIWFTESAGNYIGRMTLGGTVTRFMVPTAASGPLQIVTGPDSNLWFTETNAGKIGRFTP